MSWALDRGQLVEQVENTIEVAMSPSSRRSVLRASIAGHAASLVRAVRLGVSSSSALLLGQSRAHAREQLTSEQVQSAIRNGLHYIKKEQLPDGSWPNPGNHHQHTVGPTSLALYALLIAGESPESKAVQDGLSFLERFTPDQVNGNYAVGLQTMVYAAIDPERYAVRLASNVDWIERAQIRVGDRNPGWPGSWAHTSDKTRRGDNSSSQYALLGLNAAARVGIPVKQEVWGLARRFLLQSQKPDGGWSYYPNVANSKTTASMTCAGISGLVITGQYLVESREHLDHATDTIHDCGKVQENAAIEKALAWLTKHFSVVDNPGSWFATQWKFYYLYGLERVGRFLGLRDIGLHDWYREGAAELVSIQAPLVGSWTGAAVERESFIATSFAVLFLATGRSPVLVNKLKHGTGSDWNNDHDDIRNLVDVISDQWKHLLTWQMVDIETTNVERLLIAPIAYMSGHEAPKLSTRAKVTLRAYLDQGGCLFAEACCDSPRFDDGFRKLIAEIYPEREAEVGLRALPDDHSLWRARHLLNADVHPLWGLERGCRTVVVYSPRDLSCFWNQMRTHPASPRVCLARQVGENIVDYVTGREIPADKLVAQEVREFQTESPKRGTIQIAKLRHAGDWNVAPLAIPVLARSLRTVAGFDVAINHKELFAKDPNLVFYPLIYFHGRAAFTFSDEEVLALRNHIEPGGGTLFADAACGSIAFDSAFRRFVAKLFPDRKLELIPPGDELFSTKVGYDLSNVNLTRAAGEGRGFPQLEGIQSDGHWGIIYSRLDIGCALQKNVSLDCKGYASESALRIASNIVIYSTLP